MQHEAEATDAIPWVCLSNTLDGFSLGGYCAHPCPKAVPMLGMHLAPHNRVLWCAMSPFQERHGAVQMVFSSGVPCRPLLLIEKTMAHSARTDNRKGRGSVFCDAGPRHFGSARPFQEVAL